MPEKKHSLEKKYNKIVESIQAVTPAEAKQILERFPLVVSEGVIQELDQVAEAHRYHAHAKRAYYFRREGPVLTIWSWNEVLSYKEAADIHSHIFELAKRLTQDRANEVYSRATGRTIGEADAS